MWSNTGYSQQGYGKILLPDDREYSDGSQESEQSSQDSQSSEEVDSSREEKEPYILGIGYMMRY